MARTQSYAAYVIRELLARGPHPGEDFYRLQLSGNGQTHHVNVSPEKAERIAELLDDPAELPRFPRKGDHAMTRPVPIHKDDQPESGPAQRYYDHQRVPGDPLSELALALAARGWACVIAHTGGGCMAVSVELDDVRSVLIGADPPGNEWALSEATSGGLDVESIDDPNGYLGSASFKCPAGRFVDAAQHVLEGVRDGKIKPGDPFLDLGEVLS